MKIENLTSKAFLISSGVHQGNPLSATIFNLILDSVIKKLNHRGDTSLKLMQIVAYADDVSLLARSLKALKEILYIKMNVCLYVCLYLIQIHISEPIRTKICTHLPRGLEETVGYVWAHNISTFPPFQPILSGAGADLCAVDGCQCHTALLQRYICVAACTGVTSGTVVDCAMKTWRTEWNACV